MIFMVNFFVFASLKFLAEAGDVCQISSSVEGTLSGKRLVNHIISQVTGSNRMKCYADCENDQRCQSINYLYDTMTCELNNRTKEARPDDLVDYDSGWYMRRDNKVALGSIKELPGASCEEIKLSDESSTTGWYWMDVNNTGNASRVVCDMEMKDIDECASGSHKCQAKTTCNNTKGGYNCTCVSAMYYPVSPYKCSEMHCQYYALKGFSSGIYDIEYYNKSTGVQSMQVYCQIDKSIPKGWLVFQRRLDGSVDFKRDWATYKTGFGNLSGEFWMGLEKIHQLSYQEPMELRVELEDWDGNMRYAEYSGFYVDTEAANYRLIFFGYSAGDAGDSLKAHNGIAFATIDRDDSAKCANTVKSGWWFMGCHFANLNGLYNVGGTCARLKGINWDTWRGLRYSYKKARMMMVPTG